MSGVGSIRRTAPGGRHGLRHARPRPRTSRRTTPTSVAAAPDRRSSSHELTARYAALGGISPLAQRTQAQLDAIAAALDDSRARTVRDPAGPEARRAVHRGRGGVTGRRGGRPRSSAWSWRRTTRASASDSTTSGPARTAAAGRSRLRRRRQLEPGARLRRAPGRVGLRAELADLPERTKVVFTAHSLPGAGARGRPLPRPARCLGRAPSPPAPGSATGPRGASAGSPPGAHPSRGGGPTSSTSSASSRRPDGPTGSLVVPQGFTSDHLEVIYDLDIEARSRRRPAGTGVRPDRGRQRRPTVMGALAERIRALAGPGT